MTAMPVSKHAFRLTVEKSFNELKVPVPAERIKVNIKKIIRIRELLYDLEKLFFCFCFFH
jgi:hypothetical protein